MKFKIYTEEKQKAKKALIEFVDEYLKEFEDQKGKRVFGFKVTIKPLPPVITEEKDGLGLNIPLPFPRWAMFMVKKKDWIKFIDEFLKERKINFKEIKFMGG
jgi:hypothetical protein